MTCNDPMRFFVVGSPRSGTTLLQAMLNRHPDIVVPPETKVYCDFDGRSRTQQGRCVNRLRSDFSLPTEWCYPPNAEQLLVSVQSQFLKTVGRANAKWVGEKTPEHTSRLRRIREDFPEAPIIAVVRNGFDVAASLTHVPWIRCGYGSGGIIWNYYMNHVCRSFQRKPNHFLIVTYEELCRDPVSVLNQIFSLLNVDSHFAESCLSPDAEKDRFLFPARELEWKSRALQPLQPALVDDRHLSQRHQSQIRVACEPMLKQWGYIRDIQPISIGERYFWNAVNATECARTVASLPRGRLANEISILVRGKSKNLFCGRDCTNALANGANDGIPSPCDAGVVH